MDAKEYRDQVAREMAAAKATPAPAVPRGSDAGIDAALKVLADGGAADDARIAALTSLKAAAFASTNLAARRPEYLAALRAAVDSSRGALQHRVVATLAREKDASTQQRLVDGLTDPSRALLPPEEAIPLIGEDVKAGVYPLLRAIVAKPPNDAARVAALRVLAADATSKDVFEKVLRDKGESAEARKVAAAALQSLEPDAFHEHARAMVLDPSETEDMHAASLSALAHFAGDAALAGDDELQKGVDALHARTASPVVKRSARAFLDRVRR